MTDAPTWLACGYPADAIFPCADIRDLADGEGIEP